METLITEFLNSEAVLELLHMSITFFSVSFGIRAVLRLCGEYTLGDFLEEKKEPKTPSYYYEKDNGFFEEDYNEKYWSE